VDAFFAALTWPLALCLVLGVLLTYLGAQVLERRAVFADLAVAQVAGLGAVWGLLLGWSIDTSPWAIRAFALGFTVLAAAILAGQRSFEQDLSREALAGALYALSAAATVLIGASLHHGPEEVRDLLAGKALFARPSGVLSAAVLFAPVGFLVHRFEARMRPARARDKQGRRAVAAPHGAQWDFAFYAALGLAVSYAVPLVGVLLVFSYLLLPAATAALVARAGPGRLRAGWLACAAGTLLGLWLAYASDLPPEPSVALCLGLQFVAALVARYMLDARDRLGASLAVLSCAALVAMLLAWSFQLRAREQAIDPTAPDAPSGARTALVDRLSMEPGLWDSERAAISALLAGDDPEIRARLLDLIAARGEGSLLEHVHALLGDPDDLVRDSALNCVRALARPESVPVLVAASAEERDDYLEVDIGETLLALGSAHGLAVLLNVMESGESELARAEAFEQLTRHWPAAPRDLVYDPASEAPARKAEVAALRAALDGAVE